MWLTGAEVQASLGAPVCTPAQAAAVAAAAQDYIEKWCRREFEAADVAAWLRAPCFPTLHLLRYPVNHLHSVSCDTENGLRVAYGGSGRYASLSTSPLEATVTVTGPAATTALVLATYPTMALLAAAVTALGAGWSATVENEGTPSDIRPCAFGDVRSSGAVLELPGRPSDADLVDAESGVVLLAELPVSALRRRSPTVFASYNGGYAAVPDGLHEVGLEMACDVLRAAKRDSMLASESLGAYSWTLRNDPEYGGLWRAYEGRLQPWKRMVV